MSAQPFGFTFILLTKPNGFEKASPTFYSSDMSTYFIYPLISDSFQLTPSARHPYAKAKLQRRLSQLVLRHVISVRGGAQHSGSGDTYSLHARPQSAPGVPELLLSVSAA